MPKVNTTKKLAPTKLIKTNGKFSKKKLGLFVLGFGLVGTVLLRFSFAATAPTVKYYNTPGVSHPGGGYNSDVFKGGAWGAFGGSPTASTIWVVDFPEQVGYTAAPSGVAFRGCIELQLQANDVSAKKIQLSYKLFNLNQVNLSVNDLKSAMNAKADGSALSASGADWVKGVYCKNLQGGGAGNYTVAPRVSIDMINRTSNGPTVWVNYTSLSRQ